MRGGVAEIKRHCALRGAQTRGSHCALLSSSCGGGGGGPCEDGERTETRGGSGGGGGGGGGARGDGSGDGTAARGGAGGSGEEELRSFLASLRLEARHAEALEAQEVDLSLLRSANDDELRVLLEVRASWRSTPSAESCAELAAPDLCVD